MKQKMDKIIGIITFHRANNFGAVLQNYALQKAIEKIGYSCEDIDYRNQKIEEQYRIFSSIRNRGISQILSKKKWEIINLPESIISKIRFSKFRNQFINISKRKFTRASINETKYDLYISGSDQVWNDTISGCHDYKTYFLDFTKEKKAAYAASCGNADLIKKYFDYLGTFDYITVREEDLSQVLSHNGIVSHVVCDPVFLLSQKEWNNLLSPKSNATRFVYLYYIDSGREDASRIAKKIAQEKNCSVLYSKKKDRLAISGKYGINHYSDGPIQFIQNISESEYVVVSSFHGTAFAIIMHKEFVAILHKDTGSRVLTLLEKLQLTDRIVNDYDDYLEKRKHWVPIDYSKVDDLLDEWRRNSIIELRKICEI